MLNYRSIKLPALALIGTLVIILSTLVSFDLPGSIIPQTGQTLGVLVVAAILGQTLGVISVLIYLLIGLLGLPVFADGTLGPEVFFGPTRGYLFGFIFSALFCGWYCGKNYKLSFYSIFAIMLFSHILILIMGWLWLSSIIGPYPAILQGVLPFLYGALFKSLIATIVVKAAFKLKIYLLQSNFIRI